MRWIAILMLVGAWFLVIAPNTACAQAKSAVQLSDSQFVDLYVKLSLVAEKFLADSLTLQAKQDSLFKTFKITRDQFVSFREKYNQEPEKYKYIWQEVIKKLDAEEAKAKAAAPPPPDQLKEPAKK